MKLRDYQQTAVKAIQDNSKGIISAATGSGKTTIMAAAIKEQEGSVLILVHTKALLTQTVARMKEETNRSVGSFYGEDKTGLGKEIVVATWQSMSQLHNLQYDHVHVDECHNARGKKYGQLIKSIKCSTLHGYTATLHGPGEDAIKAIFGNIIFEIGLFELIQQGYLSKMKVLINIGPVGAQKYNEQKFGIIREQTKDNGTVLKALHFYNRVKRFKEIEKWNLLPSESYASVHAMVKREARERMFDDFRNINNGLKHILSNRVLNEGIDLPITNTLVFHETVGDFRTVSQRFGRGLRVYEGNDTNTTIIMLFVDEAKRSQLIAVNELIDQVQYEGKKRNVETVRTISGEGYHKHDNDPTDDCPITINLLDKTQDILDRFNFGKQLVKDGNSIDDFISEMRKRNITRGAHYFKCWREIDGGKYGSTPSFKFQIDAQDLWRKVRGIEEVNIEDFISDMKKIPVECLNGNYYFKNWKQIHSGKWGSHPERLFKMSKAQIWSIVYKELAI